MPEQKKLAFIFDLEGVLIDHTKRQCEVATKALASVGLKVSITLEMYQLRSEDAFHITRDFLSGLYIMQKQGLSFAQAKAKPERIKQLRKKLRQGEWEKIDQAVKNFDNLRTYGKLKLAGQPEIVIKSKEPRLANILTMLNTAKSNGIPSVMVTAGKKVDADAFMREAGLLKSFRNLPGKPRRLYGEDRMKKGGLFAEASKMIARVYGIRAGRQFVVEDSLSGIKAAKANGLRSVMVLTGNTSLERIRKLKPEERPSVVLRHAKDLLGTLIYTGTRRKAVRFRPKPKILKKPKARRRQPR